jgi:RNA polymerase sigma-70 factor, ECF subfamily
MTCSGTAARLSWKRAEPRRGSGDRRVPDIALQLTEHRDYLLRVAMHQLRDAVTAEDVVQETLAAALAAAEGFAGRASLRTWLTGILKLKVIDALRARGREPVALVAVEEASTEDLDVLFRADGHYEEPPCPWADPPGELEQQRFFDAVDRCLEGLPPQTACVFVLREVMEADTTEICRELAISPNYVGVLLYRARMLLRKCLEMSWFDRGTA